MLLLLTFVALGTSLLWTGLTAIDVRTLLFAAVALGVRTLVLYPVLTRAGVAGRDRRLIALFGPRGLSSLLLVLLPVFAGIPGAERLFGVVSLVVLLSVLLHGSGMALFLRENAGTRATTGTLAPAGVAASVPAYVDHAAHAAHADDAEHVEPITLEEMRALHMHRDPVVVVDARAGRGYRADPRQAAGAVRVRPESPVRDATALRLDQHATLVVYCA
jgi:NhaP-type Na+/H+ and K+/H+ antiporter